jgi:hypothetical protein
MAKRGPVRRKRKPAKTKRAAPKRKKPPKRKRSAPKKSRKKRSLRDLHKVLKSARKVFDAQGFAHDAPGWVPVGGWQGDKIAEEVSYMTHEEKIEWLEWLAEQLDTTISELFDMMGSP